MESCQENLWNEIQLKGPQRQKQTQEQNKKEWASLVSLYQKQKPQHPHHMKVSQQGQLFALRFWKIEIFCQGSADWTSIHSSTAPANTAFSLVASFCVRGWNSSQISSGFRLMKRPGVRSLHQLPAQFLWQDDGCLGVRIFLKLERECWVLQQTGCVPSSSVTTPVLWHDAGLLSVSEFLNKGERMLSTKAD